MFRKIINLADSLDKCLQACMPKLRLTQIFIDIRTGIVGAEEHDRWVLHEEVGRSEADECCTREHEL